MGDDHDIKSAIRTVVEGGTLDADQAAAAMDQIMTGAVTPAQIGALVTALRMRGETVEEIAGFASAMRRHALRVEVDPGEGFVVDTCGTGGDASGTFNISTTAAFVIAGAGVRVAKHGNRSVTSKCGSADLLEGLGVAIELSPGGRRSLRERGRDRVHVRAGVPPGDAVRRSDTARDRDSHGLQYPGTADEPRRGAASAHWRRSSRDCAETRFGVVPAGKCAGGARSRRRGARRAGAVRTVDGDRIRCQRLATCGHTVSRRRMSAWPAAAPGALAGGDVDENTRITLAVLSGEPGPRRDVTLMNAGAGIYAAEAAASIAEGRSAGEVGDRFRSGNGAARAARRIVAGAWLPRRKWPGGCRHDARSDRDHPG